MNPIKKFHNKRTVELEYTSFAENDIHASVRLTFRFLNAISRWHLHRDTSRSQINALAFWNFACALAKHFGNYGSKSTQRHTVIRSAFVYKKTREQFGLRKRTYTFRFQCTPLQKSLFLPWLSMLKLPAELTVRFQ